MRLWEYTGKFIRVTCVDEQVIEGACVCYTSALDNVEEIASIDIEKDGYLIGIMEDEIKSIEIQ